MFDFVGFLNDQLSIIKLCFYAIYYYLEVIIKHFLLPKRFVYKDISGNVVLLTGAGFKTVKSVLFTQSDF